jgi:hypothetical protein
MMLPRTSKWRKRIRQPKRKNWSTWGNVGNSRETLLIIIFVQRMATRRGHECGRMALSRLTLSVTISENTISFNIEHELPPLSLLASRTIVTFIGTRLRPKPPGTSRQCWFSACRPHGELHPHYRRVVSCCTTSGLWCCTSRHLPFDMMAAVARSADIEVMDTACHARVGPSRSQCILTIYRVLRTPCGDPVQNRDG